MLPNLPFEIWFIIAESLFTKASLRSLCLVSKAFNAIFTPRLYEIINLPGVKCLLKPDQIQKLKAFSELDSETHLRFARHLELGKGWKSIPEVSIDPVLLRAVWGKMTNLKSCKVW